MHDVLERRIQFWEKIFVRTLFPEQPSQEMMTTITNDGKAQSRTVTAKEVADQALAAWDAKFRETTSAKANKVPTAETAAADYPGPILRHTDRDHTVRHDSE